MLLLILRRQDNLHVPGRIDYYSRYGGILLRPYVHVVVESSFFQLHLESVPSTLRTSMFYFDVDR